MLCLDHVVLLRCCRASWEAAKPHFGRFQKGCTVILHGRRGTSWHLDVFDKVSKVTLCDRPARERSFLDDFHSLRQAQHCEDVHVTFLWQARHLRRAVSRVFVESHWQWLTKCKCRGRRGTWCAPFFRARRNVWWSSVVHGMSSFVAGAKFWTLLRLQNWFLRHWLDTSPHSTLQSQTTPHSTLHTLHCKLHTLHSRLFTPCCALDTSQPSTLHTPQFWTHTPYNTFHTPRLTLYTLRFPLHTPHSTLSTRHSTLDRLYSPQFMLHTPHFTLRTLYSTL